MIDAEMPMPEAEDALLFVNGDRNPFQKKWFLAAGGFLLIILLVVLFLAGVARKDTPEINEIDTIPAVSDVPVPTPTMTLQLKQAVGAAKQSEVEYINLETNSRTEFPWIRKFPVAGEGKYFVYFDIEKKVFVGKIYPQSGDDVEELKSKAKRHVEQREIPTDEYPFEWRVTSL